MRLLIAVCGCGLGFLLGAAPAHAVQVTCGQTISQDTKVSNNLKDCPGDGLVIGTDGVTLNLNGHTIDGDGQGGDNGILIPGGTDDAIVLNGNVKEFDVGVNVIDCKVLRLIGLTVSDNSGAGVVLSNAKNGLIRNVRALNNGGAGFLAFFDSFDLVFQRTVAEGNAGDGFSFAPSRFNLIEDSRAARNDGTGIFIDTNSNDNFARDVTSERNGARGIEIDGDNNILLRAFVQRNGEQGVLLGTTNNVKLVDNVVSRNALDGFFVTGGAQGTLVQGNSSSRNGGDGIDAENPITTFRRNTTNDNALFGIEAVPGVTDLGGNRAKGNDAAQQCVNVNCT